MKPCEDVIVTVHVSGKSVDMELPAFLQIKELKARVFETVQVLFPGVRMNANHMSLHCRGEELPGDRCLASCGVWDGAIIQCVCKGEE